MTAGEKMKIHGYFDSFLKEKYYFMDTEALSFDDVYAMSEQFFSYKGLPILFRDVIFYLLGYCYAISDNLDESIHFYARL